MMPRNVGKILTIACAALAVAPQMRADTVRLYGTAADYAGINIEVNTYSDFITHNISNLGVINADNDGHFDIDIELTQTTFAFLDLGSYHAGIYLEPGCEYEIVLPPFRPRPDADRFNPFYQPEQIELGIANQTDCLNEAIRNFDLFFNSRYHQMAIRMVRSRNKVLADNLIALCDSAAEAQNCDNPFFEKYVEYRKARVYATPRLRQPKSVAQKYFTHRDVAYNVPTYWETFRLIFKDIVVSTSRSRKGAAMTEAITKRDFSSLVAALARDSVYADSSLCEALIISGIYDAYYSDAIGGGLADTLLAGAALQAADTLNKQLAMNVLDKKNYLKQGTSAPDFTLLDIKGNELTLSDLKGKFVYLGFLHTKNFACVKDFPALSSIAKKYRRDMVVVGILTDEESDKLPKFFSRKKYDWHILSFNYKQSVVLDYRIEAQPSYFLIDPDGRLALSPAPSPTEAIESAIAEQMQKYKKEQLQKSPQGPRSIYDLVRNAQ